MCLNSISPSPGVSESNVVTSCHFHTLSREDQNVPSAAFVDTGVYGRISMSLESETFANARIQAQVGKLSGLSGSGSEKVRGRASRLA